MKVLLTSTESRPRQYCYRLPNGALNDFTLAPYALNHEVEFSDEQVFESFKEQCSIYILGERPILLIGKQNGAKAEKINEATEKDRAKVINAAVETSVESIVARTEDSGVKIHVEVEKNQPVRKARA